MPFPDEEKQNPRVEITFPDQEKQNPDEEMPVSQRGKAKSSCGNRFSPGVRDIFRAIRGNSQKEKGRRTMAHVIRAWRISRTIRFLVLIAALAATTQVILSRGAREAQNGAVRQTTV